MDHIFLPLTIAPQIYAYPGLADYIGIPFLRYPTLANKGTHYLQADQGGYSRQLDLWSSNDSLDETEFFATWLFCGLLQEVLSIVPQQLGEASLYSHEDFVCHRTDRHGREIRNAFCTEQLVSLLEQWSLLMGRHKNQCEKQHAHLKRCMDMTHNLLSWKSIKLERYVKIIVAATAELLCLAIDSTFRNAGFFSSGSECPNTWAMFIEDREHQSSLIANGWCPSDAFEVSSGNFPFAQTLLFTYYLTRRERTAFYRSCPDHQPPSPSPERKEHGSCTRAKCHALGGPGSFQVPQIGCTCTMFEFGGRLWDRLPNIIDGGIMLVRFCNHPSGSYSMDIVPYTDGVKFVAISHVWSDGFGNPEANAMLQCRLDCIRKAVLRSWKDATSEDTAKVLIWLDTLCCPLAPAEARKKGFRSMRTIYEKAEYVLVLDGELLNIAVTNMADLEIGWRILVSGWMSRLWTLQEGYLAKNLWVAFEDKAFRLDALREMEPRLSSLNQRHLWSHLKYLYWSLRWRLANQNTFGDQIWDLFWAAIHKRHVTDPRDEPFCISTFFNLNTGAIIDTAPEDQMKRFWQLIGEHDIEIPSGIIFHEQPRLTVDGYRWAPATFLNGHATDKWALGSGDAKLTADGLVLKLKAFSILRTTLSQTASENSESPLIKIAEQLQLKDLCYARDQHGVWYSLIPREVIENAEQYSDHATNGAKISRVPSSLDESFTRKMFPDLNLQYVAIQQKATDLALLGTVRKTIKGMNTVTPFRRIVLVKDFSFQAAVFEIARAEAHNIAQSDGFNTFDEAGLTKAVEAGAKEAALRSEKEGITYPQSFDEQKKTLLMATNILLMLTDQHHMDAISLPEDTEWCMT